MSGLDDWTRRRFLAASSAAAGLSLVRVPGFAQPQQGNAIPPPTAITGGIRPLFRENTARPLRYKAEGGDFLIENGGEFFNRPIYGAISDFRVDAGDRPEFSLYLPGHGGNLKFGFVTKQGAKWAAEAETVIARYRPGRMIYEIRDASLQHGTLTLELIAASTGSGVLIKVTARQLPEGTSIAWAFGGLSGRKGRRNGDIGCEVEPVSQFFQLRPEECDGNTYTQATDANGRPSSTVSSKAGEIRLTFPPGSQSGIEEFSAWRSAPNAAAKSVRSAKQPILTGYMPAGDHAIYFTLQHRLVAFRRRRQPEHVSSG